MNTLFTTAGLRNSKVRWLRQRELKGYVKLLVWQLGQSSHWASHYIKLHNNILQLWKSNGSLFTTQYLAIACRIIVLWVARETYTPDKSGVRVARARSGLPLILPKELRFSLINRGNVSFTKFLRLTLSILSVYRVIACVPVLKLNTITDSFSGLYSTLPQEEVSRARSLLRHDLKLEPAFPLFLSESAGPNYPKATWGAGLDALAFLRHPSVLFSYVRIAFATHSYGTIFWLISILLLSFPIMPLLLVLGKYPKYLGKLTALNEARGKVRVVAITDWWTQVLLKPLHHAIFNVLKTIRQDGTFDQLAPVHRLMAYVRSSNAPVFSFDLSAATDRLPIALQIQVLESFGIYWATSWANLLVGRPWWFKGKKVMYSVGQPMGALSSWAMLALTHHILVQVAAGRVGWKVWFNLYAVIGDDIVIADETVSKSYTALISDLGVSINITKSYVTKSGVLEFAKRWIHPFEGDFSPIGPGIALICARNPRLLPILIRDMINRDFAISLSLKKDISKLLNMLRPKKWVEKYELFIDLVIFGPIGGLWRDSQGASFEAVWIKLFRLDTPSKVRYLYSAVLDRVVSEVHKHRDDANSRQENLSKNFWKYSLLGTSITLGLLSLPLTLISPGYWSYVYNVYTTREEILESHMLGRRLMNRILGGIDIVPSDDNPFGLLYFTSYKLGLRTSGEVLDWTHRREANDYILAQQQLIDAVKLHDNEDGARLRRLASDGRMYWDLFAEKYHSLLKDPE